MNLESELLKFSSKSQKSGELLNLKQIILYLHHLS